jgi:hypothetical protein
MLGREKRVKVSGIRSFLYERYSDKRFEQEDKCIRFYNHARKLIESNPKLGKRFLHQAHRIYHEISEQDFQSVPLFLQRVSLIVENLYQLKEIKDQGGFISVRLRIPSPRYIRS